MAANSQAALPAPLNRSSATSGNSARGMASTIATMSTTKDISRTGRVPMNASPASTDRSPGRTVRPAVASAGSRSAA